MCCFSRAVEHVSETQIFARPVAGGRQALIYSMRIKAGEDLAMILPIPVAQPAREDAVQFVSLEEYPDLFAGLRRGFPEAAARASFGGSRGDAHALGPAPLKVLDVGSFSASFVPTIRDFARLDPQFRLPDGVWEKLGPYASYGFTVFKLKKGEARIHPMAFVFPTAIPDRLFFPTVHIHDGIVHRRANFDHALYCQIARGGLRSLASWDESAGPASRFVNTKSAKNLILPEQHVFRRRLAGEHDNEDVTLRVA